ncbi:Lysine-specific demethylase 6B, partial [Dissostichus eleginoides]
PLIGTHLKERWRHSSEFPSFEAADPALPREQRNRGGGEEPRSPSSRHPEVSCGPNCPIVLCTIRAPMTPSFMHSLCSLPVLLQALVFMYNLSRFESGALIRCIFSGMRMCRVVRESLGSAGWKWAYMPNIRHPRWKAGPFV